jgi:hypothetical protein
VAFGGRRQLGVLFYDLRTDRAGDPPLTTRPWLRTSRDGSRWREWRLGGPFDLRTAPVRTGASPGYFLGDYQGLTGTPTGFAALFAQAAPIAELGATDGFFQSLTLR